MDCEQSYAAWPQEQLDAPHHPPLSQLPLRTLTPQLKRPMVGEMEILPAQIDHHGQQQQPSEESLGVAPSYPPARTVPSSSPSPAPSSQQDQDQQRHQASACTEATAPFPPNLPSPRVPIRLSLRSTIPNHLTGGPHPHPHIPPTQHAHHAAPSPPSPQLSHREPFIRAASRRLQAVSGLRNDLPFDLLMGSGANDAANLVLGADGRLVDLGLRIRSAADHAGARESGRRGGRNRVVRRGGAAEGDGQIWGTDVDVDGNTNTNTNTNTNNSAHHRPNIPNSLNVPPSSSSSSPHNPPPPHTIPPSIPPSPSPSLTIPLPLPTINPQTGQGLREYLLAYTRINKSTPARECRSISLHDFTPNLRTGEFRNQLLWHLGVDKLSSSSLPSRGERIEVRELSLPDANGTLHPWLSIFIQRPLVTLDPPLINSASTSSSTPPNFPKPTPTSWLCLAVPLANITSYPIQADASLPPALLEETPSTKKKGGLPTFKIAQRQDYDFSFQGIPIFEFSTRTLFTAPQEDDNDVPIADFLSVDGLAPYEPADPYGEFPAEVTQNPGLLHAICRKYAEAAGVRGEELRTFGDVVQDASGVDLSQELPPNDGVWWSAFYRGMTRDRIRWEKVRRSMGRGRCRVVLRWQEMPEERKTKGTTGSSPRTSEAEKIMEEMTRESMQGKKRKARNGGMMSSSSRQDVGLGVTHANGGTRAYCVRSVTGEGSRDSLRAKAMGNKMGINGGVNGGFGTQNLGEKMQGMIGDFRG
ncbi:hypothetical protein DSL72_008667 [Monilinia vaccinii-corymbosi]|uniref:Uncharacterized protein n=1 Tax=Monilinia vaccinii-corymbosi TaxID=61207 RepID=A0A8A3PRR6_9HELO|nr:hypothetical protein DSL72_008667 [Monilinia vaccinii-corymbosi]